MLDRLTGSPLRGLANARTSRSRRISSYDVGGGNRDARPIAPWETLTLAEIEGAGLINHIWFTISHDDVFYPRRMVLRIYWDGEDTPSVECPVGDFFGVGHGRTRHYMAMALNMVGARRIQPFAAMNCFFPMPFARGARITMTNESDLTARSMYYYIDYEQTDTQSEEALRFHAVWNRERNTNGPGSAEEWKLVNLDGKDNYVILEAEGRGHYVGCNVSIDNTEGGWPGEGDDMIFIDGEQWPPSLHGTGTEDYFCAAWGFPSGEYAGPYHGISYMEDPEGATGKTTVYRHHIEDPVTFARSIRVTIEHRHANAGRDDWSSVGYWYQTEPHRPFTPMLPSDDRLPRMDPNEQAFYDLSRKVARIRCSHEGTDMLPTPEWHWVWDVWHKSLELHHNGNTDRALMLLESVKGKFADAEKNRGEG